MPKRERKTERIFIRIQPSMKEKIEKIAEGNFRKFTDEVRYALNEHIKKSLQPDSELEELKEVI